MIKLVWCAFEYTCMKQMLFSGWIWVNKSFFCLFVTVKDNAVVDRMSLNDNKAGMDGLDKARINQIIHEASKGKSI